MKIDALYGQPPELAAGYEATGMARLRREAHSRMLGNGLCTRPAELQDHLAEFTGPCLLVTHDPLEALVLADRLIVLEGGRIVQEGTPAHIARKLATGYVAKLVGLNLYAGRAGGSQVALTEGGVFVVPDQGQHGDVLIAVRPSAVIVSKQHPQPSSACNTCPAKVDGLTLLADRVRLDLAGQPPALVDVTPQPSQNYSSAPAGVAQRQSHRARGLRSRRHTASLSLPRATVLREPSRLSGGESPILVTNIVLGWIQSGCTCASRTVMRLRMTDPVRTGACPCGGMPCVDLLEICSPSVIVERKVASTIPCGASVTDLIHGRGRAPLPVSRAVLRGVPAGGERPEMTAALAREEFPALLADPGVVYLDSATTTQKPQRVIDAVTAELATATANPGRGAYPWASRAARRLTDVRERAARFIGAQDPEEVVFVPGATAGLNAVALSWGMANLADGDEILFSPLDHASTVYPWVNLRQVLARSGTRITLVPYSVTVTGEADIADILSKVSARTRLIVATHVHNMFGSMTTLEELRGRIGASVRLCFDCTQSAGHVPVNVTRLNSDFAVFSGHKMFGIPGTGVVYVRRRVHPELALFLPGGGSDVRLLDGRLQGLRMPQGMEGGTPNLPGIAALGVAMDFIDELGIDRIAAHGRALTRFLIGRLREIPHLTLLPGVARGDCPAGYGIVSFRLDGVRSDDLGFALSSQGFYVRAGRHCLPAGSGYQDSVRVSVHVYNSGEELDRFAGVLAGLAEGAG